MATKKQKREAGLAKREAFLEQEREIGLAAQRRAREEQEREMARIKEETEKATRRSLRTRANIAAVVLALTLKRDA